MSTIYSWRGKDEFVENTQKKCVSVHLNGEFDHGKGDFFHYYIQPSDVTTLSLAVIYIEPDWNYLDLLNASSQRLDLVPSAKRIFNANGEI